MSEDCSTPPTVESNTTAASPAAAAVTNMKKTKAIKVAPPCPPEVATAYLILRGAVAAVTGAACVSLNNNNSNSSSSTTTMTCSLLQSTYVSEPGTGKFSIGLGKKNGDICELDLPSTPEGCEALYTALEATANRIIAEEWPVVVHAMPPRDIVHQWGDGCLDSSLLLWDQPKKNKATAATAAAATAPLVDAVWNVAMIPQFLVAVTPTIPLAHTKNNRVLTGLQLDRSQCSVLCAERNAKVQLKFKIVTSNSNNDNESAPVALAEIVLDAPLSAPFLETTTLLQQARIRCPEGLALKEELMLFMML